MQEDDSNKDQGTSSAPKTSIPVMSDVKPAENTADSSTSSVISDSSMATPPKDDVMPDLANESVPAAQEPAHVSAVTPSAADAVKKKSGMGMVIGIVVGVVIVLAAVGYFAFVKKDKSASSAATPAATKTTTATKADPAAASSTIDSSLSSLDQSKDFNSADLSDTSLGL